MGHILVIEDDEHVRSTLRTTLEHAGYDVEEAPDGETGLKLLRRTRADLGITDIVMPNKDGFEVIQEIRRDYRDVKIVAISGGGISDPQFLLHTATLLGVDRTFDKPLNWGELHEAVRELTNHIH